MFSATNKITVRSTKYRGEPFQPHFLPPHRSPLRPLPLPTPPRPPPFPSSPSRSLSQTFTPLQKLHSSLRLNFPHTSKLIKFETIDKQKVPIIEQTERQARFALPFHVTESASSSFTSLSIEPCSVKSQTDQIAFPNG